jgi:hypothetical protein
MVEPPYRRSVFWRPLRSLFEERGQLPGDGRVLWYGVSPERWLPFARLNGNKDRSLILWPAVPPGSSIAATDKGQQPLDHITLDLRNSRNPKSHVTGFDAHGKRCRDPRKFRLRRTPESGAALWCICAFRWTVLEQQCGEFERIARVPKRDEHRLEDEFIEDGRRVTEHPLLLAIPAPRGDYAVSAFYVLRANAPDWFSSKAFPMGSLWDEEVEGWADRDHFDVALGAVEIESIRVGIATACPPGHLKHDVFIGLPR